MDLGSIKGIFLRYLLMPIFAFIMIYIMTAIRKGKPDIKIKTIIIYVLLNSLAFMLLGVLGVSGNLFSPYWYLFSMFICLGLGILHVNLLHHYFRKHFDIMWKAILFDFVLSITCLLVGGYLFSFVFNFVGKGLGNEYMAATSLLIFIVPLVFYYTYIQFISIPFDIYKTWQFDPEQKAYNFKGVDFDQLMVLNVELSKIVDDQQRFNIKAKTLPTEITFGEWFFRVVDDYNFKNSNSKIELFDETGKAYYWIFYVKKSFFSMRKYIDFEQDIISNKLTENEYVICKRVIHNKEEGHAFNK
ncbi:TssN family type VI secretion system protein [Frigoriflavimonas asaccharolytica]|uniref:Uncharacterized protein n=1 Tax=Frigoriflavimonas asaccharolytica TaxID=2735899 RepID=A0A8J8K9M9_9FLAO|nr:TssN family type VI secretion system protein [Frigoriflavimonas asaccharolytica]NRS93841.1 hypothetical protein [Frigoriflavimonas asaccharolytica]